MNQESELAGATGDAGNMSSVLALLAAGAPPEQVLPAIVSAMRVSHPALALSILTDLSDAGAARIYRDPRLPAMYLQELVAHPDSLALPESDPGLRTVGALANRYGVDVLGIGRLPGRDLADGFAIAHTVSAARPVAGWREAFDQALQMAAIAVNCARMQNRLVDSERRREQLEMAIAGSATGIWDRNLQTGEIHYSDGWKALLGYEPSDVSNRIEDAYQRLHPDDLADVQAAIQAHVDGRSESYAVEHRIRCKDGSYKWIASRGRIVAHDEQGRPLRMIGSTVDVTERKRIELELQELATTDFLTRLPNRRHFLERMEDELARLKRIDGARAAVLMCDLAHFKTINDRHGHAGGDAVLRHFAQLLRDTMRSIDFAGRVGGEEFAVVLPGASEVDAEALGRRLQQALGSHPFREAGQAIPLTVSIGIAALQANDHDAGNALSRSDDALYRAKREGRNRIVR